MTKVHLPLGWEMDAMPCPFCKGEDLSVRGGMGYPFRVSCSSCDANGPWLRSAREAVEVWNRGVIPVRGWLGVGSRSPV